MYVWSGSAWVSVATEVESLANYATVNYASTQPGMKMVVPTSVAVGSGSGSVDTNGAVTFSGASTVSLNGCFSSTYDNYKIILEIESASANTQISMRMRVAGTDNSASNYWNNRFYGQASSLVSTGATAAGTSFLTVAEYETGVATSILDLFQPFKIGTTRMIGSGEFRYASFYQHSFVKTGQMTVTTSYDGFTLLNTAGNITGTIRVYGYKN